MYRMCNKCIRGLKKVCKRVLFIALGCQYVFCRRFSTSSIYIYFVFINVSTTYSYIMNSS